MQSKNNHPRPQPTNFTDLRPPAAHARKKLNGFSLGIASVLRLKNNKTFLKKAGIILLVVVAVLFAYSYKNTRDELKRASDPQAAARQEADKLATKIGRYLELPEGETPSIATVKNAEQLKEQSFFARAKNGDKVLVYPTAKRAVLYRPSTNKVIEYAPVQSTPDQ